MEKIGIEVIGNADEKEVMDIAKAFNKFKKESIGLYVNPESLITVVVSELVNMIVIARHIKGDDMAIDILRFFKESLDIVEAHKDEITKDLDEKLEIINNIPEDLREEMVDSILKKLKDGEL